MRLIAKIFFNAGIGISKWNLLPVAVRRKILRICGLDINSKAVICSNVDFKSRNVSIGESSLINKNCCLYAGEKGKIYIGENVQLAFNVLITTQTHQIGNEAKRSGENAEYDVSIGKGSWIGMGAVVLPGVSIGKGCVIGGGAVVVSDCEENSLYVGTPAKMVRRLYMDERKEYHEFSNTCSRNKK